jgi:hypothetical protein
VNLFFSKDFFHASIPRYDQLVRSKWFVRM